MKRVLLLIAGLLLLPILLIVLWWAAQPTDPINAANFDRIEVGMTEQQVEEILGGPEAGEIQLEIQRQWETIKDLSTPKFWNGGGDRVITVNFRIQDGKDVVASKEFFSPNWWDRMQAWLGDYELTPHPVGGRSKRLKAAA